MNEDVTILGPYGEYVIESAKSDAHEKAITQQ